MSANINKDCLFKKGKFKNWRVCLMTAVEKANFDICIDLLAQYIEKYADKVLEEIEAENESKK